MIEKSALAVDDKRSQHPEARRVSSLCWDYIPTWNGFRAVGESKILRSSYVWFVVVPVAARIVEAVRSPLSMTIFGEQVTLNIDLPFSWKAFFFASVAFTIANLLYVLRCPTFVREHKDFADFTSKGMRQRHIGLAAKRLENRIRDGWELGQFIDDYNSWVRDREGYAVTETEESRRETFWMVFDRLNTDYLWWRFTLGGLYLIGFAMIGFVVLQNVYYVVRLTVS